MENQIVKEREIKADGDCLMQTSSFVNGAYGYEKRHRSESSINPESRLGEKEKIDRLQSFNLESFDHRANCKHSPTKDLTNDDSFQFPQIPSQTYSMKRKFKLDNKIHEENKKAKQAESKEVGNSSFPAQQLVPRSPMMLHDFSSFKLSMWHWRKGITFYHLNSPCGTRGKK